MRKLVNNDCVTEDELKQLRKETETTIESLKADMVTMMLILKCKPGDKIGIKSYYSCDPTEYEIVQLPSFNSRYSEFIVKSESGIMRPINMKAYHDSIVFL